MAAPVAAPGRTMTGTLRFLSVAPVGFLHNSPDRRCRTRDILVLDQDIVMATPTQPRPAHSAARTPPGADSRDVDDDFAAEAGATPVGTGAARVDEAPTAATRPAGPAQDQVLDEQHRRFGGIKVGSAFFGWLAATGLAVLVLALLAAAGVGLGYANNTGQSGQNGAAVAKTVGLVGGIVLIVVLALAYYCGGYIAGRMARFDGVRQGVAVWVWGILFAIIVAILAAVAGSKYNLSSLNLPRIPVGEGTVTTAAIIFAVIAVIVSLLAAMAGGAAGMRFHRRVDETGYDTHPTSH